jgi:hypothetical protein
LIEKRVEVGETELAFIFGEETRDHEEDFKGKPGDGIAKEARWRGEM